jgi:hypothetical protein
MIITPSRRENVSPNISSKPRANDSFDANAPISQKIEGLCVTLDRVSATGVAQHVFHRHDLTRIVVKLF